MSAQVITITSGKGGVGKTTATANLGVAIATLGNRVACIDADIGLRNLDVVMGLENRIVYNLVDVIEGRARLRQAMIKDKRLKEDLYLIPAAQTRDKTAVSPSDMIRICDELREMVDFVLVDSPAGIERGFRNAIAPADKVVIVTNPEVSSVRDADRIIGLIEAEGKGPGQLVINRVKPDMIKRGDMLSPDDIIDILAIELIGLIPEDENILISTNRGTPIVLDIEGTLAGKAFLNIARRLMGENVPFMPLEEESTGFQKLLRSIGLGKKPGGEAETRPRPKVTARPAEPEEPKAASAPQPDKPAPAPAPAPPTATPKVAPAPTARTADAAPSAPPAPAAQAPGPKPATPEAQPPTPPKPAPAPEPVESKKPPAVDLKASAPAASKPAATGSELPEFLAARGKEQPTDGSGPSLPDTLKDAKTEASARSKLIKPATTDEKPEKPSPKPEEKKNCRSQR